MAITKKSFVERVLIVFNEDGSLKSAAQYTLDAIIEDGKVLTAQQGPATEIAPGALATVLGATAAGLMAQVTTTKSAAEESAKRARELEVALSSARDELSAAKAALVAAHDERAVHLAEIGLLRTDRDEKINEAATARAVSVKALQLRDAAKALADEREAAVAAANAKLVEAAHRIEGAAARIAELEAQLPKAEAA